jgi:hypothetical protein
MTLPYAFNPVLSAFRGQTVLELTFFGKKLPAGEEIISLNHVIIVAKNEKPPEPGAVPMVYG